MPILLLRARRRLRQLRKFAGNSPSNHAGKFCFVQAEMASVMGRNESAHMYFTSSILHLREAGFYLLLGMANDLAGKHYERLQEHEQPERFLREAERVYRDWGGHAKADQVVAQIDNLSLTSTNIRYTALL